MIRTIARAVRRIWSRPDDPRAEDDVVPHFPGRRRADRRDRPRAWSVRRTVLFVLVMCIPIWMLIVWLMLR
ncbi:hypothetical protein P7B02_04370 [Caulobacter segnis]|uniref:hypothetical protein n=1 Tax=Caulobacter segnis TaxID=88688 RepID=UPI0024100450|nr:hypothetical protein [Caulobacter segnis]MDG2520769.1 hypothetical protein [Caulobacter segnis]